MESRREFYTDCQTQYGCPSADNVECGKILLCPRIYKISKLCYKYTNGFTAYLKTFSFNRLDKER